MRRIANKDIRNMAKAKNVYIWEIADALGVCAETVTRKLRHELDDEEKAKFKKAIQEIYLKNSKYC